ncbi:hypothetical protein Tco_1546446 [Tanacetum coccineum]
MPTTTTMFAATTPKNTHLAYRASTSTNPSPVISPAFVEANYETLESLLRDRRRQMRNNDLQTELEYFIEDYDEERKWSQDQNLPGPHREKGEWATFTVFPDFRLQRGSFANLPQGGHVPSTFTNGNILPQNGFRHPMNIPPNSYPFYTQTIYTFPNMPAYANPNSTGLFPNPLGSVTPFVRWIEDYPLPDGLKMPSHIGSYNGKGDPDNFLHIFKGAIRMQKWLMLVACHMFTYTLKDSTRICQQKKFTKTHLAAHNIKQRENKNTQAFITRYTNDTLQILGLNEDQQISGFIHGLRTRSLVEHLSTDLPPTYRGLMEKTYTWVEAREVATNGVLNDQRDSFERPKKSSWNNNKGQMDRSRSFPYKGESHKLLSNLVKSPREILATERVAKTFKRPPRLPRPNWSKDKTRYRHFHKDYGHETNKCQELKHQVEKAVKTGQLTHLVKGVTKKREKTFDTQSGEKNKEGKWK